MVHVSNVRLDHTTKMKLVVQNARSADLANLFHQNIVLAKVRPTVKHVHKGQTQLVNQEQEHANVFMGIPEDTDLDPVRVVPIQAMSVTKVIKYFKMDTG